MRSHTFLAVVVAAVLVPAGARAQYREWDEDYTEPGDHADGYDVAVDLNVSGAVTFDTFHGPLSAHGDWVSVGSYGRVWRPHVAAGWRPYYHGRWEWTNEGWFWVSDEPWGWAAYHYGRWAYDPQFGWVWVPGYQWAPAWVSWRTSGDVIGWAPLAPGLSVYVTTYPFVDFWWTFVPTTRFVSVPVYTVAYAPTYTRRYFEATAPAPARPAPRGVAGRPASRSPSPAWGGPAPRVIEQRIGRPLAASRIVRAPSPGGATARPGEIAVYRPERGGAVRPSAPARGQGAIAAPGRQGGIAAPGRGHEGGRFTPPAVERAQPQPGWGRPQRQEGRVAPGFAPRQGGGAARPDGAAARPERRSEAPPAARGAVPPRAERQHQAQPPPRAQPRAEPQRQVVRPPGGGQAPHRGNGGERERSSGRAR